jgi:hypothetical protein
MEETGVVQIDKAIIGRCGRLAKFNFRLQPLLNVKEQIETQKEIEYGQALRKLEEERQKKIRLLK